MPMAQSCVSITVPSSTSNTVWTNWNTSYTTTSTSTGSTVIWTALNDTYVTTSTTTNLYVAPPETEAQRSHRIEREAQYARDRVRIEAERATARDKAEILLRSNLSPKQLEELNQRGHFFVESIAKNGERRRYRIDRGRSGNVKQVDAKGEVIKVLCAHPRVDCPDADTMLAQKFWLETNEQGFLGIANVHANYERRAA